MAHGNGGSDERDEHGQGGQGGQPGQGQPAGGQGGQGQPAGGQGQPTQGRPGQGQPAGGHGQPAAGQGGQGQPAQGQPAQGQPAGGYQQPQGGPAGGPAHQEGVGDIFSKPSTQNELKRLLGLYLSLGIGLGFAVLIAVNQSNVNFPVGGVLGVVSTIGPVIALALGVQSANVLTEATDGQVYATTAVAALVGNILVVFLGVMFMALGTRTGNIDVATLFIIALVGGIGAAISAAGGAFATRTFSPGRA